MNKKKVLLLLPVLLLSSVSLNSCNLINPGNTSNNGGSGNNNDNSGNNSGETSGDDVSDSNVALAPSAEYKSFWKTSSTLDFKISMTSEVALKISKLQNNKESAYTDYYFPCTFTYTLNGKSTTLEEVGIRMKGNTSRHEFMNDDGTLKNGDEGKSHFKLKFGETFDGDEYKNIDDLKPYYHNWGEDTTARKSRKKRTIADMAKLNIKWDKNYDGSRSKQSYAYTSFRNAGVIAPYSSIAQTEVKIGEQSINGVYEVLEDVDEVFISRNFASDACDGDLYKCSWGATFSSSQDNTNDIGVENCTTNYHPMYDLKTNKKKSTHAALKNFISVVSDTSSSAATYKSKLENVLDVESFVKEEAVAYLLGNPDDIRNNKNNFYVYFNNKDNKATIIPYDFDRCFGIGKDWNPDGEYLKNVSPDSTKMKALNNTWQEDNLFWRTIITSSGRPARIDEYYSLYKSTIENLINNEVISTTSFTNYVNSFPAAYRGNASLAGHEQNISFNDYFSAKIATVKNTSGYNITK